MSGTDRATVFHRLLADVPLLGWLLGFLAAVLIEQAVGDDLAHVFGLPKMPVLFGILTVSKVVAEIIGVVFKGAAFEPAILLHVPAALAYLMLVYLAPIWIVARIGARATNRAAAAMDRWNLLIPALVHLGLMYAALHIWAGMSDYRLITLKITLIAVLLTLSLNIINGYMGEFSCSHPGFMAVGAYMSSLFTVGLFVDDKVLGQALMASSLDFLSFPLALIFGGLCASVAALLVAIPSFKTRGDYLEIGRAHV